MKADRTLMKHTAVALAATGAVLALVLPLAARAGAASPLGHAGPACSTGKAARGFASYVPALRSYDDNIQDSGNAPDFCASELVTNDSTTITMGIHAHNRTGFVAGDSYSVYLDTDQNAATGGGGVGAEYEVVFSGPSAQLERWNGSAFDATSAVPVPLIWVPDYGPVLVFLRSAIGNPAGFNFVLVSANGQAGDRAPDAGSWSYSTVPFALKMKSFSLGSARAGKTMTARAVVMRSDFDEPLDQGKIGCAARVGHHSLAGKGKFTGSRVVCTWRVPKGTGRLRLSGTLSASYQGVRVTRSFAARVR
jgi:hypothetical protein